MLICFSGGTVKTALGRGWTERVKVFLEASERVKIYIWVGGLNVSFFNTLGRGLNGYDYWF